MTGLEEFEVFQVIDEFISEAFERVANTRSSDNVDRISLREYEGNTAKKLQTALVMRKLEKYETAITELSDTQREAAKRLGKALNPPHLTESPQAIKRRISDIDREIAGLIQDAHLFVMQFGLTLTGGFDGLKEYKFQVSALSDVFQVRRAA